MTMQESIRTERLRQINGLGYTVEGDQGHVGELLLAAACYTQAAEFLETNGTLALWKYSPPKAWPWARHYWKPGSARRMRVKAGALIIAAQEASPDLD